MRTDILRGGDLRLSTESGAFVYRRLQPGILLTSFRGNDDGQFGVAPLERVQQEFRLFRKPVQWFFDATRVENTSLAVSDRWTSWLRTNSNVLAHMHVLTNDEQTRLRISVARHFSDLSRGMTLYIDGSEWETAIAKHTATPIRDDDPFTRPVVDIQRTQSDNHLSLRSESCCWTFRSLANRIVYSSFSGDDSGDLTDPALSEMQRLLDASRNKVLWFLDLREARNVSAEVSRTWTEWLSAQHDRLARVIALAPGPLFPLVLTLATYQSGTERLFSIHRNERLFREELLAATSHDVANALGLQSAAPGGSSII